VKKSWIRLLDAAIPFTVLLLLILQIWGSFYNLKRSIDMGYGHSYDLKAWIFTILYLLVILLIDLHLIYGKDLLPVRAICNYWGVVSLVLLAGLVRILPENLFSVVLLGVTPLPLLQPLLDPLPWTVNCALACLFCGLHWLLCRRLFRKKKQAALPHSGHENIETGGNP